MVDPQRSPAPVGWTMSPDEIQRFVRMEGDIQQLRKDVTELEGDVKDIKEAVGRIERAMAEGRGSSATWPKAGALLMGAVVLIGALGGWAIAIWKLATSGP